MNSKVQMMVCSCLGLCCSMSLSGEVIDLGTSSDPARKVNQAARFKTATTQAAPTTRAVTSRTGKDVGTLLIRFVKLNTLGEPVDLRIDGVEILCLSMPWASGYEVRASTLKLSIDTEFSSRPLKEGETYTVRGYPLAPQFKIPKIKAGDEVLVTLVVDDERLSAPAAAAIKPIHIQGRLTGLKEEGIDSSHVQVAYRVGKRATWWQVKEDGSFGGEVPALGGELAVYGVPALPRAAFYYIRRLESREIASSKNMDYTRSKAELKSVNVEFAPNIIPKHIVVVGYLWDEKARLPLYYLPFKPNQTVELSMPAGKVQPIIFLGAKDGEFFKCNLRPLGDGTRVMVTSVTSLGK